MRGHIVFFAISVGLSTAALYGNTDSSDLTYRDLSAHNHLVPFLQIRGVDDSSIHLERRAKKGKGKAQEPKAPPLRPGEHTIVESQNQANAGPSPSAASGSQPGPSNKASGTRQARNTPAGSNVVGQNRQAQTPQRPQRPRNRGDPRDLTRMREVDSGAVLASSLPPPPEPVKQPGNSVAIRPDSLIGSTPPVSPQRSRSSSPSSVEYESSGSESSSSGSTSSRSRSSSSGATSSRSRSSSRGSTSSRSSSSSPGEPSTSGRQASRPPSPGPSIRTATPPSPETHAFSFPASARPAPSRIPPSVAQGGSNIASVLSKIPVRAAVVRQHEPDFGPWLRDARGEVADAKIRAGLQIANSGVADVDPASKNVVKPYKQEAKAAKERAKAYRDTSNVYHDITRQTLASEPYGSPLANAAFLKNTLQANEAVRATKTHADTEEAVADALRAADNWRGVDKHLSTSARAFQRARLRNSHTRVFQDQYLSTVTKDVARQIPVDDVQRGSAFSKAAALRKNYETSVRDYRKEHQQYRQVREDFSGNSSSESENSFSDVKRT